MTTRADIEHALALAPEMAWLLPSRLITIALQAPRLDARAVRILERRIEARHDPR